MTRSRLVTVGVVCAVCLVAAAVVIARSGAASDRSDGGPPAATVPVASLQNRPHAVFVDTRIGEGFGRVALADLAAGPGGAVALTGLRCERVDVAGDRGLCLSADRGAVTRYRVSVLDRDLRVLWTRDLPGLPNRARVAPDGSRGAMTTFVAGDSYLAPGEFATRTELLDLGSGASLGEIEGFTVVRDGEPFSRVDFNFWGVTFAPDDANRFYATLQTGETQYLVAGDIAARLVTVLRDGVECPSLSPDGTRIAFKKRTTGPSGQVRWRLSVLDVATLTEHPLAETRSVDDQAGWLDDGTVTYGVREAETGTPTTSTFAVPADGAGAPRLLQPGAFSLAAMPGRG